MIPNKYIYIFLILFLIKNPLYTAPNELSFDQAITSINGTSSNGLGYTVKHLNNMSSETSNNILLTSPFKDNSLTDDGSLFIFESIDMNSNLEDTDSTLVINGTATDEELGLFIETNGDIDGDGLSDMVTLHPNLDEIRIYLGKFYNNWSGNIITLTDTNLTAQSNNNFIAHSISINGDLNGDGFDDLVIGKIRNTDDTNASGNVNLIFGKSDLSSLDSSTLTNASDIIFTGSSDSENAGYSVSIIADTNRDGYDELLIGTYDETTNEGSKAYLIYGQYDHFNALGNGQKVISLSNANAIFHSKDSNSDGFGESVISLGDINNDSYGDFAIGAPNTNNNGSENGAIYVYYGSSTKFDGSYTDTSAYDVKITSENSYYLGLHSILGEIDLNGDTVHDLIIGEPLGPPDPGDKGVVYIITSNQTLSGTYSPYELSSTTIINDENSGKIGFSIDSAGDINDDGVNELLIGSNGYNSDQGIGSIFQIHSTATPNTTGATIRLFSDDTYSTTITNIKNHEWIYVEVEPSSDPDNTEQNIIELVVSSNTSTENLTFSLLETGANTNIFRKPIIPIRTRTSSILNQIKSTKGDTLTFSSPYSNDLTSTLSVINSPPTMNNITATQIGTQNNTLVYIESTLIDYDNDTINFNTTTSQVQYSLDNTLWNDATLSGIVSNLETNDQGTSNTLIWNAYDNLGVSNDEIYLRVMPNDGTDYSEDYLYTSSLTLDNTAPSAPELSTPNTKFTYSVTITGNAEANTTIYIYVNNTYTTTGNVSEDGTFEITDISVSSSNNTVTAVAVDSFNFKSPTSNTITLSFGNYETIYTDNDFELIVTLPLEVTSNEETLNFTRIPTASISTSAPTLYEYIDAFSLTYGSESVTEFDSTITFNVTLETNLIVTNGISVQYYDEENVTWSSSGISLITSDLNSITFTSATLATFMIAQLEDPITPNIGNIYMNGDYLASSYYYSTTPEISTTITDSDSTISSWNITITSDTDNSTEDSTSASDLTENSVEASFTPSGLSDDDYTITISAWDSYGNTSTKTGYFRVDSSSFKFDALHAPNPFNPTQSELTFSYNVSNDVDIVMITILDQRRKKIWDYKSSDVDAGYYLTTWDGKNSIGNTVPNGIYYAYCFAKNGSTVKKEKLIIAVIK